jgi:hypothetical protein
MRVRSNNLEAAAFICVPKGWESGSGKWLGGCPAGQSRHQLHVTLEILSRGEKCSQPAWGEHHSQQTDRQTAK